MPIIKSAKKAMRQTIKRTALNSTKKTILTKAIKKFTQAKENRDSAKIYSLIDKAVKRKIIHKNKAGRIKSRLAKLLS